MFIYKKDGIIFCCMFNTFVKIFFAFTIKIVNPSLIYFFYVTILSIFFSFIFSHVFFLMTMKLRAIWNKFYKFKTYIFNCCWSSNFRINVTIICMITFTCDLSIIKVKVILFPSTKQWLSIFSSSKAFLIGSIVFCSFDSK